MLYVFGKKKTCEFDTAKRNNICILLVVYGSTKHFSLWILDPLILKY